MLDRRDRDGTTGDLLTSRRPFRWSFPRVRSRASSCNPGPSSRPNRALSSSRTLFACGLGMTCNHTHKEYRHRERERGVKLIRQGLPTHTQIGKTADKGPGNDRIMRTPPPRYLVLSPPHKREKRIVPCHARGNEQASQRESSESLSWTRLVFLPQHHPAAAPSVGSPPSEYTITTNAAKSKEKEDSERKE